MKKIDIYVKDAEGVYQYKCSTCYYKTLRDAKYQYSVLTGLSLSDIKCAYAEK